MFGFLNQQSSRTQTNRVLSSRPLPMALHKCAGEDCLSPSSPQGNPSHGIRTCLDRSYRAQSPLPENIVVAMGGQGGESPPTIRCEAAVLILQRVRSLYRLFRHIHQRPCDGFAGCVRVPYIYMCTSGMLRVVPHPSHASFRTCGYIQVSPQHNSIHTTTFGTGTKYNIHNNPWIRLIGNINPNITTYIQQHPWDWRSPTYIPGLVCVKQLVYASPDHPSDWKSL